MKSGRTLLALGALLAASCGGQGRVTRVADGTREEGRYIDGVAYSAYTQAALLEAAGDVQSALRAYRAALDSDGDSPEILTRIGALDCRLAQAGERQAEAAAMAAFDAALELDATYATAHAERATCLQRLGRRRQALESALLAVRYDADRAEWSELVARLLLAEGRKSEGFAWLDALVARQPTSPAAWRVFRQAAQAERDVARLRRARTAEQSLGVLPLEPRASAQLSSEGIDALLLAGDLDGARRAAVSSRKPASDLALRAIELGAFEVALEQARFVLRADPSDSDAWIAALAAADQVREGRDWPATLRAQGSEPTAPSPRAAALLEALLEKHVGQEAARAFHEAYARKAQQ